MPIFQCLLIASVIVSTTLGVQAFTRGIKFSSKSRAPITGTVAKIIGTVCFIYSAAIIGLVSWGIITAIRN